MYNVLIADFESNYNSLIRSLLLGNGYAVSLAESKEWMTEMLETGLFDIVIANFPEKSEGIECISGINKLLPHMPIILIENENNVYNNESVKIFNRISTPLRFNDILTALQLATANIRIIAREFKKTSITNCSLILSEDASLGCSLKRLNDHYLYLEVGSKVPDIVLTELKRKIISESYETKLEMLNIQGNEPIGVHVQLSFYDKTGANVIRDIGIKVKGDEIPLIMEYLEPIAA